MLSQLASRNTMSFSLSSPIKNGKNLMLSSPQFTLLSGSPLQVLSQLPLTAMQMNSSMAAPRGEARELS